MIRLSRKARPIHDCLDHRPIDINELLMRLWYKYGIDVSQPELSHYIRNKLSGSYVDRVRINSPNGIIYHYRSSVNEIQDSNKEKTP